MEVLGHDDHPVRTLAKVAQWLQAGVRLVWVVATDRRAARVYRLDGSESLLGPAGVLDGEDLLPGFRRPLADLW